MSRKLVLSLVFFFIFGSPALAAENYTLFNPVPDPEMRPMTTERPSKTDTVPPSAGTLPTHTPLFIAFLVGVVVMVGVLTYVPSLALGPVAEHFNIITKK